MKQKERLRKVNNFCHLWRLKVKGCLMGPFSTVAIGLLYSYPNKFPHSSPEAPHTIQARGTCTSECGNYYQ